MVKQERFLLRHFRNCQKFFGEKELYFYSFFYYTVQFLFLDNVVNSKNRTNTNSVGAVVRGRKNRENSRKNRRMLPNNYTEISSKIFVHMIDCVIYNIILTLITKSMGLKFIIRTISPNNPLFLVENSPLFSSFFPIKITQIV